MRSPLPHPDRSAPTKKPIPGRSLLVVLCVIYAPAPAHGQGVLITEAQVLEAALRRPSLDALIRSGLVAARASADGARAGNNPRIGLEHEALPTGSSENEQTLTISQRLDLTEARSLRSDAAAARGQLAELDGQSRRRALEAEVRGRFYEVLYRQARHVGVGSLVTRLSGALALVATREAAGDASTYDRQRLQLALRRARAQLTFESVERESAWLQLLAWAGSLPAETGWPRVTGELLPDPTTRYGITRHPEVEKHRVEAEVARLLARAEAEGSTPVVELQAGLKTAAADDVDRRYGYVAGLRVSLPLFADGDPARRAQEAQAAAATARSQLEATALEARARGLRLRVAALTGLVKQLRQSGSAASDQVLATAGAAYEGGEIGLLEILDAQRSVTEDELAGIDYEHAARRAATELTWIVGEGP